MSDCPQCKRKIGAKTTCRCGWVMPGTSSTGVPMQKVIACCYEMCDQPAICSVSTKTGRANVCRAHYATIERWSAPTDTPFAVECREAYKKSYAYRAKHAGEAAPGDIGGLVPSAPTVRKHGENPVERHPGQDDEELALGIARDPLETEFQNGATT